MFIYRVHHFTVPKLLLIIIFLNALFASNVVKCENLTTRVGFVTLTTGFGKLLGTVERFEVGTGRRDTQSQYFHAFRGLPYAEAPVGSLRWQDPIVKSPLPKHEIYNATTGGPFCPQWTRNGNKSELIGHEDCLYADVYVPVTGNGKPLKIMVFFHGGGFIVRAARTSIPVPLLSQQNVIVVMFNYRISIFGYLSTGTRDMAGNYGSLDQIAMLQWIQLYGKNFNGDTNGVTIFGSSIGAVSIHYLLLSKLATGLFHKAIMESGSALCERSLVPNPLDVVMHLGNEVNCDYKDFYVNPSQLVSCLRSKSTEELMIGAQHLTVQWVLPTVLGPVIDRNSRSPMTQFLPDYPENLPVINKVPVIAGITKDEGLTALVKLSNQFSAEQLMNVGFIQRVILPHYLNLIMRHRVSKFSRGQYIQKLTEQVMQVYKDGFMVDPLLTLARILGDLWINTCHRKTLESLCIPASYATRPSPTTFAYIFTHHDQGTSPSEVNHEIQLLQNKGIQHPILSSGVGHTEEILYMLQEEKYSSERDQIMSSLLSHLWTTFAHEGQFNDMLKSSRVFNHCQRWLPVCNRDYPLFEISLDNQRLFRNFRFKEINFWWSIHLDTFNDNLNNEI